MRWDGVCVHNIEGMIDGEDVVMWEVGMKCDWDWGWGGRGEMWRDCGMMMWGGTHGVEWLRTRLELWENEWMGGIMMEDVIWKWEMSECLRDGGWMRICEWMWEGGWWCVVVWVNIQTRLMREWVLGRELIVEDDVAYWRRNNEWRGNKRGIEDDCGRIETAWRWIEWLMNRWKQEWMNWKTSTDKWWYRHLRWCVCVGGGGVEITVDEWVERQIEVSDCWKPSQYENWEEDWWVMRDSSEVRETCVCGIEECGWFVWVLVMVVVYWWCGNSWMMMWYVRRDLMIIVCVSVEGVGMIGVVE